MDSNGSFCPFGVACQFAHGYDDLRVCRTLPAEGHRAMQPMAWQGGLPAQPGHAMMPRRAYDPMAEPYALPRGPYPEAPPYMEGGGGGGGGAPFRGPPHAAAPYAVEGPGAAYPGDAGPPGAYASNSPYTASEPPHGYAPRDGMNYTPPLASAYAPMDFREAPGYMPQHMPQPMQQQQQQPQQQPQRFYPNAQPVLGFPSHAAHPRLLPPAFVPAGDNSQPPLRDAPFSESKPQELDCPQQEPLLLPQEHPVRYGSVQLADCDRETTWSQPKSRNLSTSEEDADLVLLHDAISNLSVGSETAPVGLQGSPPRSG